MSFFTTFGASVYKNSLRLLNAGAYRMPLTTTKPAITMPANRSYHIMTSGSNCHTTPVGAATTSSSINTTTTITGMGVQRLLTPFTSLLTQVAGFKVKGRLRRRCKDCYFVLRQQRLYVICPTHPRHKQMAMKKREKNTWILTHATQSKIRPW